MTTWNEVSTTLADGGWTGHLLVTDGAPPEHCRLRSAFHVVGVAAVVDEKVLPLLRTTLDDAVGDGNLRRQLGGQRVIEKRPVKRQA